MLTSSTQLRNMSFHVVGWTRTAAKCTKMKNARAKRAKLLFFIVKYANLFRVLSLSSSWLLKPPNIGGGGHFWGVGWFGIREVDSR